MSSPPASAMTRAAFSPWPTPAPTPTAVSFSHPRPDPTAQLPPRRFGAHGARPRNPPADPPGRRRLNQDNPRRSGRRSISHHPRRVYRRGGHRESIHGVEHPRRAVYSALRSTRMRGSTIIRRELLPSLDQQPPGGLAGPAGRPIESIRAFHVGQELDRVLRAHDAQTMLKARSPLPGCPAGIGARRTLYPGLSQQRVTDYRKKAKLP